MQLKLIDIRYTTVAHFRQCSRICGGVGVSNDHGDDKKVAAPVPTLPVVTNTSIPVVKFHSAQRGPILGPSPC